MIAPTIKSLKQSVEMELRKQRELKGNLQILSKPTRHISGGAPRGITHAFGYRRDENKLCIERGNSWMRKRLSLLFLVGILVFATTVGAYAQSTGPVVIGGLMSLTGGLAPYGIPIQNAIDLAAADINAQGGILNG